MAKRLLRVAAIGAVIFILLLGILYYIGGQTYESNAEVAIDSDPDTVFTYLTTDELLESWLDGITEFTRLTEGGHKVGAKAKIIVQPEGSAPVEMISEVLRSEDGKLLEVRITSSMFTIDSLYELAPKDDMTHLTLNLKSDYTGIARFFAPFAGGEVQKKLDEDFLRLKELVESQPASSEQITESPAEQEESESDSTGDGKTPEATGATVGQTEEVNEEQE